MAEAMGLSFYGGVCEIMYGYFFMYIGGVCERRYEYGFL